MKTYCKKNYFKVVRVIDSRYYSALTRGSASVEYKRDEFVRAPQWLRDQDQHLLVFTELFAAKSFQSDLIWFTSKIFRVEVRMPRLHLPKWDFPDQLGLTRTVYHQLGRQYPDYSQAVRYVKLVEEIS